MANVPKIKSARATPIATSATKKEPIMRVKELALLDDDAPVMTAKKELKRGAVPVMTELEERVNDLGESWETESLFEDAIEEVETFAADDTEACTADEAVGYRQMLRAVGPEEFCRRTIGNGIITARKLVTAFGVRPPAFLEGQADDAYFPIVSLCISRELAKRAKLLQHNSVDDAVELLQKAQNIIVLTGAGISTSLGIPDFRSKGIGLYSKLDHLGLTDPQEVFDISVFRQDPTIFYSVAKDILPDQGRFSPTHAFIAMLQEKGKLLTNYSQNIDNLEARAGIRPDKLVQCHGSFATASCILCGYKCGSDSPFPNGDTIFGIIKSGRIPRCPKCAPKERTTANSRKRKLGRDGADKKPRRRPGDYDSTSDSEYDLPSKGGVMKPDITFFGERLPDEFNKRLSEHDRERVDLVIVIGTSLKVAPVSEVVPYLPPQIPQIYISRTPVGHVNFDIDMLGDCDVVVSELCRRARWDLHHDMIPANQVIDVELQEGYKSRYVFTDVTSQESAPKESVPKESAPKESSPKESSPKESSPKGSSSKGPSPKGSSPKESSPKESSPKTS